MVGTPEKIASAAMGGMKAAKATIEANPNDENWMITFASMIDAIQRHTQEEENQISPAAQSAMGEDEAKALLPRFEAVKKSVQLH